MKLYRIRRGVDQKYLGSRGKWTVEGRFYQRKGDVTAAIARLQRYWPRGVFVVEEWEAQPI